ncbi:MAG: aminomethyl-transferring glycine dehydrogenase [Planctomycetota bacterium]
MTELAPHPDRFVDRHLGPGATERQAMLKTLGYASLDALIDTVVPASIRRSGPLAVPAAATEAEAIAEIRSLAELNKLRTSWIGQGYHNCFVPPVIQRNVLENPGWYTQYTPYQAEISQGRLEMLLNFQTMITELTGLDLSNASVLDEATAAAEAMAMCANNKADAPVFLISRKVHPQTIDVVRTRANELGIEVRVADHREVAVDAKVCGALIQYPGTDGPIRDFRPFAEKLHAVGALLVAACDPLALCVLEPPATFGADIAIGNTQRFGVPLGFGGPHAGYMAVRDSLKRGIPGRLVGVSKDRHGNQALRLALQTREQHIRREKATSNICTAQALLANMAAMYAIWHGPEGLNAIATRVHRMTRLLAAGLQRLGYEIRTEVYFDTIKVGKGPRLPTEIARIADARGIDLRIPDAQHVVINLDETVTTAHVEALWAVFNGSTAPGFTATDVGLPAAALGQFARRGDFLRQSVFHQYRSETAMLRYLRLLESRDLSLTSSMIPLGSCTMKLNAAAELMPLSWREFGNLHPFAPATATAGYQRLFAQLEQWLAEITGFHAVSLQPNAGSQGEYAGLLAIRSHHRARGEGHRDICLIPTSAHGTNPASASMTGLKVVAVACDKDGNVDLADLRKKAAEHSKALCCLMVTYPSTHGVFEAGIKDACAITHEHGGQVYMDGANMNAQVGLTSPGLIGADVCHLNLHKTFAIPHGGGGPGMGPICVARHLAPYLPKHCVVAVGGSGSVPGAVSAAPWGSASILTISWMYIRMLGPDGLTAATKTAILSANYIAHRLAPYYPTLYRGVKGLVAHECILDIRPLAAQTGIGAEDISKRLMDYGFHAPTLSFPVAGTLMIEPTESEPKEELDRFCDAMIAIRAEIQAVSDGKSDKLDNPPKMAPHTASEVCADAWKHPYSRTVAAFPVPGIVARKFWPAVARIDNTFGDRNLICTCPSVEEMAARG